MLSRSPLPLGVCVAFSSPFFPSPSQPPRTPLPGPLHHKRGHRVPLLHALSPSFLPGFLTNLLPAVVPPPLPPAWGRIGAEGEVSHELVTEYGPAERVVAIGDVHGDVGALRTALKLGGVLGEANEWVGGRTVLVQVGDMVDRGNEEREVLELLFRLQDEAAKAGGRVFLLLGNHELMNIRMDFRYVPLGGPGGLVKVRDWPLGFGRIRLDWWRRKPKVPPHLEARARAFRGPLMRELGMRCQLAVIVGKTVFVHAGLMPHHFFHHRVTGKKSKDWVRTLHFYNSDIRRWLLKQKRFSRKYPYILKGGDSPIFSRCYSNHPIIPESSPVCKLLYLTLGMLGCERMVVGHSIQQNGISGACSDKLWRIDTGMSKALIRSGNPETLEIDRKGKIRVLTPSGVLDAKQRRGS